MGQSERTLRHLGKRVAEQQDQAPEARLDRARGRARLLATPAPPPPRRALAIRVVAPLAAALLLAVLVLVVRPREPVRFQLGTTGPGVVGAWIAAPPGAELPIRFSDGSVLRLAPGGRARVAAVDADGAEVALERGSLDLAVVHRDRTRWTVRVGPFQVHVIGTRFETHWDPMTEQFGVALREGAITVSGPVVGEARAVRAGERLTVTVSATAGTLEVGAIDATETDGGLAPASDPDGGHPGEDTPAAPASPSAPAVTAHGSAAAPLLPGPPAAMAGVEAPATTSWRALARDVHYKDALAAAEREGFEAICGSASAGDSARPRRRGQARGEHGARGAGVHGPARALPRLAGGGLRHVRAREDRAGPDQGLRGRCGLVHPLSERAARRRLRRGCARAPRRGRGQAGRRGRRAPRRGALPRRVPGRLARGLRAAGGGPGRRAVAVKALLLACAVAAVALPPGVARAEGEAPSTIAVLCAPGDRFGLRLVAELESLGFAAVIVDPGDAPASRAALEASARRAGAVAAIRAVPAERGVEVWIADRVTGKTVLRVVPTEGDVEADAALALRTVELLRASLLEISLPAPPAGEVPATPQLRARMDLPPPAAPAMPAAPVLRIAIGFGPMGSPGGLGAAGVLDLGVAWMPSDHFGATLFAVIPLSRPDVAGAPGSADLAAGLGGLGARFLLATRASRWAPTIDTGLAVVGLASKGSANPGFTSSSAFAATAAPFVRFGLAFAPTPRFRLRADLLGAVLVQAASVQLAAQQFATWGRPVGLFSAGVDFGLF